MQMLPLDMAEAAPTELPVRCKDSGSTTLRNIEVEAKQESNSESPTEAPAIKSKDAKVNKQTPARPTLEKANSFFEMRND